MFASASNEAGAIFAGAIVGIALAIVLGIIVYKMIESWAEVRVAVANKDKYLADAAQANANAAESQYQKALLERSGTIEPIKLHISQETIDSLAMEQITKRLASMKISLSTEIKV